MGIRIQRRENQKSDPRVGVANMTPEEYIQERLEDQITWYDNKSMVAQQWFKWLRTVEVLAAALIPLLAGFGGLGSWNNLSIGILGGLVVFIASLLSLNQFQENWIEYRTTCESLKHEKFLYLTNVAPYNEKDPVGLLVQRVESLISKENTAWSQYTRSAADASKPKTDKP